MSIGKLRRALIAAELAAYHQKIDGLHLDERPSGSRDLMYRLQTGADCRVPARLVRAALGVPVVDLASGGYLITADDELVALDSQGARRADYPAAAA